MSVKMFFKAVHEEKRPVKASVRTTQTGSVVPVQAHQANRRIADQDAPKPRQMNLFGQQDLFQRKPELAEAKRTIEDKPEPKSIGKTRSGKDIYDVFDYEKHKNFTQQDHMDATLYHSHLLLDLIKRGQGESEKGKLHRATAEKHYQKTNGSQDDYDKANIHVFNHKNKSNKITVERQNFLNKQYYVARRGYDSEKSFISPDDAVKKLKERYDTESKMKINSAEAIGEMMNQYDSKKAEWIKQKGSDKGFDDWFTEQAYGKETAAKIKNAKPASPVEQAKATIEGDSAKTPKPFYEDWSIGKTRSGKHVYDSHKDYKHDNFTMQDHMDAAAFHEKMATDWTRRGMMGDDKASERAYNHLYQAEAHHKKAGVNDAWDTMPKNIHDEYAKAKEHANKTMDLGALEGAGLPKNLADLTGDQTYSIIKQLSKKPLKELRKRQDLVADQIKLAYQKQDIEAARNLEIQERHLTTAVDWKGFPEDAPKSAKEM